jgi:hypothetical protein
VAQSRELKSPLKNKNQERILERERRELKKWISMMFFTFTEWPGAQRGRWGLFIAPTSKRVIGRHFIG